MTLNPKPNMQNYELEPKTLDQYPKTLNRVVIVFLVECARQGAYEKLELRCSITYYMENIIN